MSRGFVKEGDQEETPIVTPRAVLPDGTPNYVTPTGLELLKQERETLVSEQEANKDNRIQYNYLTAKILQIDERINSAEIVDNTNKNNGEIRFGAWVTYLNGQNQKQTIRIVGVDEADAVHGKISFLSPLAKALTGHKKEEKVEFQRPNSAEILQIESVFYGEEGTAFVVEIAPTKELTAQERLAAMIREKNKPTEAAIEIEPADADEENDEDEIDETADKERFIQEKKKEENEFLPLVNERGNMVGRAFRWQCHEGNKLLHPTVHLYIKNSKGEMFLQKRPSWKKIEPGKWDVAVGGHVKLLEKTEAALIREAEEELKLKNFKAKFVKSYVYESAVEKELVHIYFLKYDGDLSPTDETDGGRFWPMEEIKANLKKKVFTSWFEKEIGWIS